MECYAPFIQFMSSWISWSYFGYHLIVLYLLIYCEYPFSCLSTYVYLFIYLASYNHTIGFVCCIHLSRMFQFLVELFSTLTLLIPLNSPVPSKKLSHQLIAYVILCSYNDVIVNNGDADIWRGKYMSPFVYTCVFLSWSSLSLNNTVVWTSKDSVCTDAHESNSLSKGRY